MTRVVSSPVALPGTLAGDERAALLRIDRPGRESAGFLLMAEPLPASVKTEAS
jgi:hypothetical protein